MTKPALASPSALRQCAAMPRQNIRLTGATRAMTSHAKMPRLIRRWRYIRLLRFTALEPTRYRRVYLFIGLPHTPLHFALAVYAMGRIDMPVDDDSRLEATPSADAEPAPAARRSRTPVSRRQASATLSGFAARTAASPHQLGYDGYGATGVGIRIASDGRRAKRDGSRAGRWRSGQVSRQFRDGPTATFSSISPARAYIASDRYRQRHSSMPGSR